MQLYKYLYASTPHASSSDEPVESPTGVTDSCKMPHGSWEHSRENSGRVAKCYSLLSHFSSPNLQDLQSFQYKKE